MSPNSGASAWPDRRSPLRVPDEAVLGDAASAVVERSQSSQRLMAEEERDLTLERVDLAHAGAREARMLLAELAQMKSRLRAARCATRSLIASGYAGHWPISDGDTFSNSTSNINVAPPAIGPPGVPVLP